MAYKKPLGVTADQVHRIGSPDRVDLGIFNIGPLGANLAVLSNAVTVSSSRHLLSASGTESQRQLHTINGGVNGDVIVLQPHPSSSTFTIKTAVGNIVAAGDFIITPASKSSITLMFDGSNWIELARSGNLTYTPITIPFVHNGAGEFYWVTSANIANINSWNAQMVKINNVTVTNTYTSTLPPKINGNYYIYFVANVSYAHFEAN
jgi:hypothetical protein